MKPYKELDSIGKKARQASGKLNCEKCPMKAKCTPIVFRVCTYVFDEGFRKGYNQRKREEKCREEKKRDRQRLKDELSKARRLLCLQYELGLFCFAERTEKLIKSMEEVLEKAQR